MTKNTASEYITAYSLPSLVTKKKRLTISTIGNDDGHEGHGPERQHLHGKKRLDTLTHNKLRVFAFL
jgi:hypothetical protein